MRLVHGIAIGTFMAAACAAGVAPAQNGYALEFDGTDDYVETPDAFNVYDGALTIEAWIRADSFGGGRIISNRAVGEDAGYELMVFEPGRIALVADAHEVVSADISGWLGQWVHVAATWEGPPDGEAIFYVDGSPVSNVTSSNTLTDAGTGLRIGCGPWYDNFFDGAIDEPRVFATVVSSSTLRTWMNRTISNEHPDQGYVRGAWTFEEGSGQTAACWVLSPGYDGRLGAGTGPDSADPQWIASGMVGTEARTWSAVKELYGD